MQISLLIRMTRITKPHVNISFAHKFDQRQVCRISGLYDVIVKFLFPLLNAEDTFISVVTYRWSMVDDVICKLYPFLDVTMLS